MVVIACGALANEIIQLQRLNDWSFFELDCIPAQIHNRPEKIPERVKTKILEAKAQGKEVFVAFADCGTGGLLDEVLNEYQVERLPGAHCYEFYATATVFEALNEEELGSFYLTDFLARHFEKLVIEGLGIDKHPELRAMYFGNYKRLVYLAQTENPDLLIRAQKAAEQLGLEFHTRYTGYGNLATRLAQIAQTPAAIIQSQRSQISMSAKLTIVYWRDIPSQVIAQKGRERFSLPLSERFEKAIDAAAMLAGASSSDAYMEHWRKVIKPCSDDLETEARTVLTELEQHYDAARLRDLIKAKGLKEASV